jgi:hypothetical protein
MSIKRIRFGVTSLIVGSVSIVLASAGVYAHSLRLSHHGVLLQWLSDHGLVQANPGAIPTASAPGVFSIGDEGATSILLGSAWLSAGVAMVIALMAEYRREPNLYLSGGFICGALAVMFMRPVAGFGAMIAGITIAMVLRHGRET